MSAAAAKMAPQRAAVERAIEPKGNYTKVPNLLLDELPGKVSSLVEYAAILRIHRLTVGGADRPLWTAMPASELARQCRVSKEAAENALRHAEKSGFIESRMRGKFKEYRVLIGGIEEGEEKQQRKLRIERTPDESGRLALGPGEVSGAVRITDTVQARWRNESRFPVLLDFRERDGVLDIRIDSPVDAKLHGSPGGKYGESKANDRATQLRQSDRSSTETKGIASLSKLDLACMEEFLIRWCGRKLGPPDAFTVKRACVARGEAADESLARALREKISKANDYGLVITLFQAEAQKAIQEMRREAAAKDRRKSEDEATLREWASRSAEDRAAVELELLTMAANRDGAIRALAEIERQDPGVVARAAKSCTPEVQRLAKEIGYG